mmetsp:Transcript_21414/g.38713  ORF Transcript_21414/g.38713 Transcript_21414/m.38713 type:complete len:80 (+) Transcript_21414:207-446(+)
MARRNRKRLTCAHAFDDFLNNANPRGLAITTRVAANAVAAVRVSLPPPCLTNASEIFCSASGMKRMVFLIAANKYLVCN